MNRAPSTGPRRACVLCGRVPAVHNGVRFAVDGGLCRPCWKRLYDRERHEKREATGAGR